MSFLAPIHRTVCSARYQYFGGLIFTAQIGGIHFGAGVLHLAMIYARCYYQSVSSPGDVFIASARMSYKTLILIHILGAALELAEAVLLGLPDRASRLAALLWPYVYAPDEHVAYLSIGGECTLGSLGLEQALPIAKYKL